MRKKSVICVILAFFLFVCGCGDNYVPRWLIQSDESIVDMQMVSLLDAIESQDRDALLTLFAPSALDNAENIQRSIELLYSYYQGNHVSYNNWGATGSSKDSNDDHIVKKLYGTYDVVTDKDTYRFAFLYVAADSANSENVGFQSVYVIRMEDDVSTQYAYRGDQTYAPGIHIGIQNKLPDEV